MRRSTEEAHAHLGRPDAQETRPPWLGVSAEHTQDRDALLHGTWLARSYLLRDNLDQTVATTNSLLAYAATVRSRHTRDILHTLDTDLARRPELRNHTTVQDLRRRSATVTAR
ncbi:hypothetical protein [Streptomyces hoynatensis]|uniref:Uncharacterized protein n=1 Tax=Streptomyces hoynatensis TaxID=1141874 RepID=A0A3A9YQH8_9ACTN|nr:hypothetical protein [Streptomyces hoynatensis]RKN38210.1 hypothetical protein D7294_25570 [Streptomyces hoynatensis]